MNRIRVKTSRPTESTELGHKSNCFLATRWISEVSPSEWKWINKKVFNLKSNFLRSSVHQPYTRKGWLTYVRWQKEPGWIPIDNFFFAIPHYWLRDQIIWKFVCRDSDQKAARDFTIPSHFSRLSSPLFFPHSRFLFLSLPSSSLLRLPLVPVVVFSIFLTSFLLFQWPRRYSGRLLPPQSATPRSIIPSVIPI